MKGKELFLGVSLSLMLALGVPLSVYAAGDGPTAGGSGVTIRTRISLAPQMCISLPAQAKPGQPGQK